jgi:hypothetical protein
MVESSKTVGVRKDLIDVKAGWVKVSSGSPTSVLSAAETYADGAPENRIQYS